MAEDRAVPVLPAESQPEPKTLPTQWISATVADPKAVEAAALIMQDWGFLVSGACKNSLPKFRHEISQQKNSFTSGQILWQQFLTSEQDLAGCAETQARTKALMQFIQWPKQAAEIAKGKKKDALKAKVNVMALKMNRTLLKCFAGYTQIHKKLGHVDFIFNLLIVVSDHGEAPCLGICPKNICFFYVFDFYSSGCA